MQLSFDVQPLEVREAGPHIVLGSINSQMVKNDIAYLQWRILGNHGIPESLNYVD
jgi:hypothetical protein